MKLNQKQKKMLIIVATIVLVVIIVLIVNSSKKKDQVGQGGSEQEQTKIIEGEKLAEVKKYKGLEISNITFKIDDKMTDIKADVYNPTSQKVEQQWVTINVLDKEGNRITAIGGLIGELEPGGRTKIDTSILSNGKDREAYDVELTEQREIVTPEPDTAGTDNQTTNN